jgi:chromosome transmission fidelity protein 1
MKGRGALLTCVVGGKLSEGINFSDALARYHSINHTPFDPYHRSHHSRMYPLLVLDVS